MFRTKVFCKMGYYEKCHVSILSGFLSLVFSSDKKKIIVNRISLEEMFFFVSLPWLRIFSGIPMKMWTESSLWDPLKLQPCKHSSFSIVTVQYGHLCSFLLSVKNSSLEMLWIEQRETTWDFFKWSSHQDKGGQQLLPGSSWDFPQKKKC